MYLVRETERIKAHSYKGPFVALCDIKGEVVGCLNLHDVVCHV